MTSPCRRWVIVDRDSWYGGKPRHALLQQRFRSLLINPRHLLTLTTARVMDGRGVVPTLSPNDVETAAQVLCHLCRLLVTDKIPF